MNLTENNPMQLNNYILLVLMLLLLSCSSNAITFRVFVPPGTDSVMVIGNISDLGSWDHESALPMQKIDDTTFTATLLITSAKQLEYKFTRGSWETEALNPDSSVPANHRTTLRKSTILQHRIYQWSDNVKRKASERTLGITGNVIFHSDFYSPQLNNYRTVTVLLPPSYEDALQKHYPVLYLHDGQNVFSPWTSLSGNEWHLDETAAELTANGDMKEIIMVAIDHGEDRTGEYSPKHKGNDYSIFLVETVKPWIDSTYRSLTGPENTAVMGSSMGGIISFHLGWEFDDIFGFAGCLSPAFLVDNKEIVKRVEDYSGNKKGCLFILYNGTEELEAQLQPAVSEMIKILDRKGYIENRDYCYSIFDGATHTELEWAKQSRIIFTTFFKQ